MVKTRFKIGQQVKILDPFRLAYVLRRGSPDGRWLGAGGTLIDDATVLETPATIFDLGTTKQRLLIGWNGGDQSVWIDRD